MWNDWIRTALYRPLLLKFQVINKYICQSSYKTFAHTTKERCDQYLSNGTGNIMIGQELSSPDDFEVVLIQSPVIHELLYQYSSNLNWSTTVGKILRMHIK
jgi:hypothetical protein